MNIVTAGGAIPAGVYGTITVYGTTCLQRGVRFQTLVVKGKLSAYECVGKELQCVGGSIVCYGTTRVEHIAGRGVLRITGNIHCENIDFCGIVISSGNLICTHRFQLFGALRNTANVTTQTLHVEGSMELNTLQATHIHVFPVRSRLLSRYHIHNYDEVSLATKITGSTIEAYALHCQHIRANTVQLFENSLVDMVEYQTRYTHDKSSTILMSKHVSIPLN